jgi:ABC-type sugar transport system ATPase subunit
MSGSQPVLAAKGLVKTFPGTRALDGVSLTVLPGECHALMGENGAGKTTLLMIMSGVERADSGRLLVAGRPADFSSPRDAQAAGIGTVFQELSLVSGLSVAENILVNRAPTGLAGLLDRARMYEAAATQLALLGSRMSPRTRVRDLGVGDRQLVEIAKALSLRAQVLLLDEPTSALSAQEVTALFAVVQRLKAQGIGVVFVSHRLNEVFRFADRISVLRDGRLMGTYPRTAIDPGTAVRLMIGSDRSLLFPARAASTGQVVLEARGIATDRIGPLDLRLRAGEIVALAGLRGAGKSTLARALAGVTPLRSGRLFLDGRPVVVRGPWRALRRGIAYLPPDRVGEGSFARMSVADNLVAAALGRVSRAGFVLAGEKRRLARELTARYHVRTRGPDQTMAQLSGGNQQKTLLARCLAVRPRVLVLDEPTQGVDVGAKAEIHRLIRDLASGGIAGVMVCSDLSEVLGMADRIVVLAGGKVVAELAGEGATEEQVTRVTAKGADGA